MGIVKWREEWWFSGVFFANEFNTDLVLDEKNSLESRMAVDFLDHQENNMDDLLETQFNVFKEFTNGLQITFLKSERVDDFIKEYYQHYNKSLKLSKKERDESEKRVKSDGFFEIGDTHTDFAEVSESALVFFNPKSGLEVASAINSAFPAPNNPFYNSNESKDHFMQLLMDEFWSTELAMYCIENYKSQLPFFKESEAHLFFEDIDFLLRFWKKNNYFTKPSITFVGGNK